MARNWATIMEMGCTNMSEANEVFGKAEAKDIVGRPDYLSGARSRALAAAGIGFSLSMVGLGALADTPGNGVYAHHGMWGGGWGGMFFGFFMMLLVIAAIAAAVVLVARVLGGAGSGTAKPSGKTPLEILEERFARGEIDAEEFEERRRTLAKG